MANELPMVVPALEGEEDVTLADLDQMSPEELKDEEELVTLTKALQQLDVKAEERRKAAEAAERQRQERDALFRVQLAIDLSEERQLHREKRRQREKEELSYLYKLCEEGSAQHKAILRGTVESRQREQEEGIAQRRLRLKELQEKAEAMRVEGEERERLNREVHLSRLADLDRVQDERRRELHEIHLRYEREKEKVETERRIREREREREREWRKMEEDTAELVHQRIMDSEWQAECARMDLLSAAARHRRCLAYQKLEEKKTVQYKELMEAKEESIRQIMAIDEHLGNTIGTSSYLNLLCTAAGQKTEEQGTIFYGLRRLVGSTMYPSHLSPGASGFADRETLRMMGKLGGEEKETQTIQSTLAARNRLARKSKSGRQAG